MSSITITVPIEYSALVRASDMFHGLALDLEKKGKSPARRDDDGVEPNKATVSADALLKAVEEVDEKSPLAVFKPAATAPNAPEQPAPVAVSPGPAPAATVSPPAGVEVDSDGLPWDYRIHSSSKAKLAKTGQWKKKRGLETSLVDTVESELRAAMAAGPSTPVESTPAPTPAPVPPAAPKPTPAPAPQAAIHTFPQLMQRITAAGIPQADVLAAVNSQGLQALPLLAARPDLIPAVAVELFGG